MALEGGGAKVVETLQRNFAPCSKKKCFSIALRHTLVVLEMH